MAYNHNPGKYNPNFINNQYYPPLPNSTPPGVVHQFNNPYPQHQSYASAAQQNGGIVGNKRLANHTPRPPLPFQWNSTAGYRNVRPRGPIKMNIQTRFGTLDYRNNAAAPKNIPAARPPSVTNSSSSASPKVPATEWPPSLRDWVERVFASCRLAPANRAKVQPLVAKKITFHKNNNTLWTHTWNEEPIPGVNTSTQLTVSKNNSSNVADIRRRAMETAAKFANINIKSSTAGTRPRPPPSPPVQTYIPLNARNYKQESVKSKKKNKKKKNEKSINTMKNKKKNIIDNNTNSTSGGAGTSTSTQEELNRRARRFEKKFSSSKNSSSIDKNTLYNEECYKGDMNVAIVGTNMKVEKKYFRLVTEVDPSTVRPEPVLVKAMLLVKRKWVEEHNYTYVCDQLKAIRQDLTVQQIQNRLTVQVYQLHARIALENGDLNEFNQCQTQLMNLFSLNISNQDEMEFLAYRILYYLVVDSRLEMLRILSTLSQTSRESPLIRHSLSVQDAVISDNYHKFFDLYKTAPNMSHCVMKLLFEKIRSQSIVKIVRAFKPAPLEVSFIVKELDFTDVSEALEFLIERNIQLDPSHSLINTKTSVRTMANPSGKTTLL